MPFGWEAETITCGELFFFSLVDKAFAIFKTGANKCQAVVFITAAVGAVAETSIYGWSFSFCPSYKVSKMRIFNWLWRSVSKTRWLPDLLKVLTWPMFSCQRIIITDWLTAALDIPK